VAPLPWKAAVDFLAIIGITPQGDPARFDELQRDLAVWWERGGSARSFLRAVESGASTKVLSTDEALRCLERKFLPSWMRP
jgi:hypothetical protein